jgi:hypothetical protein
MLFLHAKLNKFYISTFYRSLAIGGDWRLATGGAWWLTVLGDWRLALRYERRELGVGTEKQREGERWSIREWETEKKNRVWDLSDDYANERVNILRATVRHITQRLITKIIGWLTNTQDSNYNSSWTPFERTYHSLSLILYNFESNHFDLNLISNWNRTQMNYELRIFLAALVFQLMLRLYWLIVIILYVVMFWICLGVDLWLYCICR